ncbi:PREDICTED: cingulin-like [Nicotiana attenuata]|uniref:cingulin-like n=1 Tax=Nicotiana attenuata TaxID=49451 RepID=UPI000904AC66|nr:PREDICTED: cingulin-like [Nicotiana attenuata]
MGQFVRVKTSDLIPAEKMPFPEKWNMEPVSWMPGAIPSLEIWVRDLASTSSYAECSWRDLPQTRCYHEASVREEEVSPPAPKPTKDKKRKRVSTSEDPKPKKSKARKPKKDKVALLAESAGMSEGARSKALRNEENVPSDSLGAIVIGDSPTLPAFFEEEIQDAQALRTPDVEGAHEGEDLFRGCFTGVEDATALSEALTLHREAFSKSRADLSRCEADLQKLTKERNALKLLSGQKEEKIKDLRAELATVHKEQTDLIEQVQQKSEKIEQLRKEVNMMRAETLGWKQNMERLASEKDAARAQLSLAESQLQGIKEERSAQAKKIEELEARLAAEHAKVKSEAEKVKADAEAAQNRAFWIAELTKCQYRRETLEEIHARGFDLTDDSRKAKELEDDAKALASSDDDDDHDAGSKSDSESVEYLDGEGDAPENN